MEGVEDGVLMDTRREGSSQDQSVALSNSTLSEGTPRGEYVRRGRKRGNGAKHQREMVIQKVKDEQTETVMKWDSFSDGRYE